MGWDHAAIDVDGVSGELKSIEGNTKWNQKLDCSGSSAVNSGEKRRKEIIVFCISIMPILELRGGLLAASLIGLNPVSSYIIAIIANIIL